MSRTKNLPRVLALQPRLPVRNLAASLGFYRDALGFNCAQPDLSDSDGFAILHRDGLALQLVLASQDRPSGPVTVWIQVDNAASEHQRVKDIAPIEWGPEVYWYGCREFSVLDPDGHHVIFSSTTKDEPTCKNEEP
jgi:catechol 2,3-dioxygenase-like lactoylglutathione lyase family enzyme